MAERLGDAELVEITTSGDRGGAQGDKSRFVKEIDEALLSGEIDLAVHSAKDVPAEHPAGLILAGAPAAEDARDALVGASSLEQLPEGARVGSSSLRRRSQLLAHRPDLEIVELHGNVDTRLRKLSQGDYDAIILALAGLVRLGRAGEVGAALPIEQFVPAAGQGIIALAVRADDLQSRRAAAATFDSNAFTRLIAERATVRALEADCHTPVGAHAGLTDSRLELIAYAGTPDGRDWITDRVAGDANDPEPLGQEIARRMLAAGANQILGRG